MQHLENVDIMPLSNSISLIAKPLIIATFASLILTGCSTTKPNNSALLFDNKPVQVTRANKQSDLLISHSTFGQTVTQVTTEEAAPLTDTLIEAHDPNERWNRKIHKFNFFFDKVLIRPTAKIYEIFVPPPVRLVVKNGLRHLEIPGDLINYTLQGNGKQAGKTFKRFAINSTLGLGGALDVAGYMGIEYNPTDFGLTLANWNVREGRYVVVPFGGPSTTRDSLGRIVDIAFSPTTYVGLITDFNFTGIIARSTSIIDKRHRNGSLLDNVIFASPDPYVTLRSTYLQRRRSSASDNILGADGMDDALPVIATAGQ